MKKKKLLIICLVTALVLSFVGACAKPAPAPATIPMPTPVPTNSESDSRVAELEAKIRQLEAENQQLKTENKQLNSELVKITAVLQTLQSLVNSSSYTLALSRLTEVQNNTIDLAYFAEGLPDLPPLPVDLTPSKIEQMVGMARVAYDIIYYLPPLPPIPPELAEIEANRQAILEVFKFVQDLHDLPEFLSGAGSLEDLKSRSENYLADVHNTTSYAGDIMRQIRDAASR